MIPVKMILTVSSYFPGIETRSVRTENGTGTSPKQNGES